MGNLLGRQMTATMLVLFSKAEFHPIDGFRTQKHRLDCRYETIEIPADFDVFSEKIDVLGLLVRIGLPPNHSPEFRANGIDEHLIRGSRLIFCKAFEFTSLLTILEKLTHVNKDHLHGALVNR